MMCWECKHDGCQMIWSEAVAELERMHPEKGKFYWETKADWKTEFADANVEMDEVGVEAEAEPVKVTAMTVYEAEGNRPRPTAEFIAEHVNTKTIANSAWDELADTLDALRERITFDDDGKVKRKFQHVGDEDILEFVTTVFQKRAKLFVDAYPYIYLPSEDKLIKFHDDVSAHQLLAKLRLRMTQYDTDLVKKNLNRGRKVTMGYVRASTSYSPRQRGQYHRDWQYRRSPAVTVLRGGASEATEQESVVMRRH